MTKPAMVSAPEQLSAEFPAWQITPGLAGRVWSAFWRTPDGRQRRCLVAGSGPELLVKLQDARCHDSASPAFASPADDVTLRN
jgi:hypothetical protein